MHRLNFVFWLALSLCSVQISLAQTLQEGTSSVSGKIQGAEGPAVVYLVAQHADPTSYYDGYQAAAEKDGRFSFRYIKPGTYRIRTEVTGFMPASPDAEEIEVTLRAGEKRAGVTVPMVRRQMVCGRVTENGVPLKRPTWVWAYRYDKGTGEISRSFLPATEPDGTYRFDDLGPGTYYLQGYTTWYPGSFNFNGAQAVSVGPGGSSSECPFNIALQYTGCHGTKVTGRIAGTPLDNSEQYRVNFVERNISGASMPTVIWDNAGSLYRAGDRFSGLLCPGKYDVVLSDKEGYGTTGDSRSHKVILDSQTITLSATEIDDLVLTPHPVASITGEVHFEGISRNASCPGLGGQYVDILREGDAQFQSATLDDKNHFEIRNVVPGNYSVFLAPFLSEAVYLKSITVDGKASEGRRISITNAAPTQLDITLSGDLEHAAGHLPPDLRRAHRWEVAWMRPKGKASGMINGDDRASYTMKLQSARYNSNASGEYTTKTAPNGSFHFDNVDPGVYTLRAEAEGMLSVEFGGREAGTTGTPIVVERGAQIRNLNMAPPKLGSICGRVTDENGAISSETEIFVEAFQYHQLADYYNFIFKRGRGPHIKLSTDHDGLFRADSLVPGDYYIGFRWRNRIPYFSSDGSVSAEAPIRLRTGESLGCNPGKPVEFHIPTGLDQVHAISGQIVEDIPKIEGDRFWINLVSETPNGQSYAGWAKVDDKRQFHVDKVPKGTYLLQLLSAYGPQRVAWSGPYGPVSHVLATKKVEIKDGDVLGVTITPERLPTVSGKAHFEDLPAEWKKNFDVTSQAIVLVPNEYRAPFSGKLATDGSFTIGPEDPGDYEVTLAQPGTQLYIRSLMLDGHAIAGRYLRLRMGQVANLEVVVGGDAAHVTATVTPDPSLPKPEPPVEQACDHQAWPDQQLVLLPDAFRAVTSDSDPSAQPVVFFGYRTGDNDHPQIRVDALPPGTYRALVAENLRRGFPFGYWHEVPAEELRHWKVLAQLGEPLTVKAGQTLELALPDKTVDVARLAAQWGLQLDAGVMNAP